MSRMNTLKTADSHTKKWQLLLLFIIALSGLYATALSESFESVTFPPTGWTLEGSPQVWARSTANAYAATGGSAYADFYNITAGVSINIVSPVFTMGTTNRLLFFDHAYATYVTENDQLEILYSINGGTSYTSLIIYTGGVSGSLVTAPPQSGVFNPTTTQWATKSIALPAGTNRLKFRGISAYGNDLYVDNIRVSDFAGGTGTLADPYLITTATELNNVRNYLGSTNASTCFKLMNDIDMLSYLSSGGAGYAMWGGNGWLALGDATTSFYGNFDGNNCTISNLRTAYYGANHGLFGVTAVGSIVKNLSLASSTYILGDTPTGSIAGRNYGSLQNCRSAATVNIGNAEAGGGIVGANNGTVTGCGFTGTITRSGGSVSCHKIGGIAGNNQTGALIENSFSSGSVTGNNWVGGIAGLNSGTVNRCYSSGTVNGSGNVAGGIAGDHYGTITNSYSRSNVSGGTYIGGLVGYTGTCTITNSYSTGTVSSGGQKGGLCGEPGATITSSYWDTQTSGLATSYGGTGKTTVEMKTQSTFTGWDFAGETANGVNNYWYASPDYNNGYPYLTWERGNEYLHPVLETPADLSTEISLSGITLSWSVFPGTLEPTSYNLYLIQGNAEHIYESGFPGQHCFYDLTGTTFNPVTTGGIAFDYSQVWYWSVKTCVDGNEYAPGANVRSFYTVEYPVESFEVGNNQNIEAINGWTQSWSGSNRHWVVNEFGTSYNRSPRTGLVNVTMESITDAWIYRPFNLTGGELYEVELYARQDMTDISQANVGIYYGTAGTAADMTHTIKAQTGVVNGDYQRISGVFTPTTTGTYYLGIHGWTYWGLYYLSMDDISLIRKTPAPVLSLNGNSLAFNQGVIGLPPATQNVTITNIGNVVLNLAASAISLMGTNANQFAISTSSGFPAALTSGQSVSIPMQFIPTSTGAKSATLRISYQSVNYDIALTGTGLYLPSELTESFESGNTNGSANISGWTYPSDSYASGHWIANSSQTSNNRAPRTGAFDLTLGDGIDGWLVHSFALTGGEIYDIELYARQNTSNPIAAYIGINYATNPTESEFLSHVITPLTTLVDGGYQRISGLFVPPTSGVYYIAFWGYNWIDVYTSLDDFKLTHRAPTAIFNYTPAAYDYGTVNIQSPSAYYNVVITNTGNLPLNLAASAISLNGTNANQFEFTTLSGFPAALNHGQSVSIPVRFNPTTEGIKNAILRISYSGTNYDVALTGFALLPHALYETFGGDVFPPLGWTADADCSHSAGRCSVIPQWSPDTIVLQTPVLSLTGSNVLHFSSTLYILGTKIRLAYFNPVTSTWINASEEISLVETGGYNMYNYSVALSSPAGNYKLGFKCYCLDAASTIYIDNIYGPSLAQIIPEAVTQLTPVNNATAQSLRPTLSWSAGTNGGIPSGYNIYLQSGSSPLIPATLVATVTSTSYHVTADLNFGTTYYWMVVATNATGAAIGSTVQAFTTRAELFDESFGTTGTAFPPTDWTCYSGQLLSPATLTPNNPTWELDDWCNLAAPVNKAARNRNYGNGRYVWLVTSPVQMTGAGLRLDLDIALTAYNTSNSITTDPTGTTGIDDRFAILVGDGLSWSPDNIVREWNNTGSPDVYNSIPSTGLHITIPLQAFLGNQYIAFYCSSDITNADNDMFIDNVHIWVAPPADLTAINLSGPATGFYDTQITHAVTITNYGTTAQNNFIVYLQSSTPARTLATITVSTALEAGASATYALTWTPGAADAGYMIIYGKAGLATDTFAMNDATASLTFQVIPTPDFALGSGAETDPYQITTARELNNVRNYLGNTSADKYFKLMNDLDLTAYLATGGAGYTAWGTSGWLPIGTNTSAFYGHFDGNYRVISGLKIQRSGTNYCGLWGYTETASTIVNLSLVNDQSIYVVGSNAVGMLVGYNKGVISNASAQGKVRSSLWGGVLTGWNDGTITRCYSGGEMIGTNNTQGGLVGQNQGSVSNSYSRATVRGMNAVGGLVGYQSNGSVTSCFAAGYVSNTGSASNKGGLIGMLYAGTLNNIYWDSQTTGMTYSAGSDPTFGKTTAEMQTVGTFTGWDFASTWVINPAVNAGYPQLGWAFALSAPITPTHVTITPGATDGVFTLSWDNMYAPWYGIYGGTTPQSLTYLGWTGNHSISLTGSSMGFYKITSGSGTAPDSQLNGRESILIPVIPAKKDSLPRERQ